VGGGEATCGTNIPEWQKVGVLTGCSKAMRGFDAAVGGVSRK